MSTLVDDEKHEVRSPFFSRLVLFIRCLTNPLSLEMMQLVFLYKLINGVASSSFGTHVAHLAGVPLDVVRRAEVVSKDFADKFKEKMKVKKEKRGEGGRMPVVARADFVFLCKVAMGEVGGEVEDEECEERVRMGEVLQRMKGIVRRYLELEKNRV